MMHVSAFMLMPAGRAGDTVHPVNPNTVGAMIAVVRVSRFLEGDSRHGGLVAHEELKLIDMHRRRVGGKRVQTNGLEAIGRSQTIELLPGVSSLHIAAGRHEGRVRSGLGGGALDGSR